MHNAINTNRQEREREAHPHLERQIDGYIETERGDPTRLSLPTCPQCRCCHRQNPYPCHEGGQTRECPYFRAIATAQTQYPKWTRPSAPLAAATEWFRPIEHIVRMVVRVRGRAHGARASAVHTGPARTGSIKPNRRSTSRRSHRHSPRNSSRPNMSLSHTLTCSRLNRTRSRGTENASVSCHIGLSVFFFVDVFLDFPRGSNCAAQ